MAGNNRRCSSQRARLSCQCARRAGKPCEGSVLCCTQSADRRLASAGNEGGCSGVDAALSASSSTRQAVASAGAGTAAGDQMLR